MIIGYISIFIEKVGMVCPETLYSRQIKFSLMLKNLATRKSAKSKKAGGKKGKYDLNRRNLNTTAAMMKAVAHPMRISIIELLDQKKEMNVTDIYGKLRLEQAVASHHLSILRRSGIVNTERNGKMIFYSVNHNRLTTLLQCVGMLLKDLD